MPTSAQHTFTCQKLEPYNYPEDAQVQPIKIAASQTLVKGTVLGRVTASNLWKAYSDAASDGTEVAKAILQYDVVTDASGNHFIGGQASSEHGNAKSHVPAYISGNFRVADLTGLDANGLADLQGTLIYGDNLSDANAVIHIG